MASLWIGSGAGWPLKGLGLASPDHQVGAHFEALDEDMAPLKSIGDFFAILSCPEVRCFHFQPKQRVLKLELWRQAIENDMNVGLTELREV